MKHILISAVQKKIQSGQWFANEDRTTEAQDIFIEQKAAAAQLNEVDILTAYNELGATSLRRVAEHAMSNKIGFFVGLDCHGCFLFNE